ncbi:MAG: prephenate dehydrogenase/arogenate dehydrogenase family protein [Gemmatimonadetes bacterium]|nr:prephenate dehydrogenase/arogenate dehydrogenase family protein [Gemmatimonadota bacterium]
MPERPLGRVTILGLGLMGGSLARAITAVDAAERVTGWSPRSTERDAALTAGAVGFASADWRQAVADADMVVLAMPLGAAVEMLPDVGAATPSAVTLTDVVSLKQPLADGAEAARVGDRWVGAHPMVGGASSGFWASRSDLYENARVWVVSGTASREHRERVEALWKAVGATTEEIDARGHDRAMALASHLPQLVSNALAGVLASEGLSPSALGPGGCDMTRLASSSPDMWLDLLAHSHPDLVKGLRGVAVEAERIADYVETLDLAELSKVMRRTATWRERR